MQACETLGTITLRVSDDLQTKIREKAKESGKSLNAYLVDLVAENIKHEAPKVERKDSILSILQDFDTYEGRFMTVKEAMLRTGLTYHQLYSRYQPYLATEREAGQGNGKRATIAAPRPGK